MKNALILPDKNIYVPSAQEGASNDLECGTHWYPWVQQELEKQHVSTRIPELPQSGVPDYKSWESKVCPTEIDEDTVLIGHGLGAGFLLRWMSEHPKKRVDQLTLVGPWHLQRKGTLGREFLGYELDRDMAKRVGQFTLLSSTDESVNMRISAKSLSERLDGLRHYRLEGFGKFMVDNSMKDASFPELLNVTERGAPGGIKIK